MDELGALRLSAAIIAQAADDMKSVYKKTMCLHNECFKGGVCDTGKLIDYLTELKRKGRFVYDLPFENQDDVTAVGFFKDNNNWGRMMLDISDIEELPKGIKDMVILLDDTSKRCVKCIEKYKRIATKNMRTEELNDECLYT
jgi:hypothetical protein